MDEEHSPPFGLPCEICELIFRLLEFKDLLNCLLVSVQWNKFIVQANFEKIWLRIDEKTEDVDEVLMTNRNFKNLRLVKLQDQAISKCFQRFRKTVKRMEVFDSCATGSVDQVIFKDLREMTLSNVSESLLHPLVQFHERLKVLNMHRVQTRGRIVAELLQLNENLTELNCYLSESTNLFKNDMTRSLKFKLKSLTISYQSNFVIDAVVLENVEKFLMCQGKSLKTISLINAASLSSLHRVWNDLRGIESLNFFSVDQCIFYESNWPALNAKESLESLELHVLGPIELRLSDVYSLLKAARNLKSLGVWKLTNELMQFAVTNLNLKSISCATIETDCKSFYDSLKSKNGFNKELKLHQYL